MDSPHRPSSAQSIGPREEKEKPWKYIGYKVFSRWVASDPSFFVLRRFGTLNARVALSLQDEIAQLEERLDHMDNKFSDRDTVDGHNGSFREDPFSKKVDGGQASVHGAPQAEPSSMGVDDRQTLVREILPVKLAKYNNFLNEYSRLVSRESCKANDIASVRRWLRIIRPAAIDVRESEYIDHDDDLISIHPKAKSPGRNFLEQVAFGGGRFNRRGIPWLREWFSRKAPKNIVSLRNEDTVWPDDQRMERVSSVFISLVGLAMLIGPIWILAYLRPILYRLAVISSFIVVFFVVLAVTRSRLYEALAATAAYSAVLVVFLQSGVGTAGNT